MTSLEYTPVGDISRIVQELRATFLSGLTKPLAYRKEQLKGLHNLVVENEAALFEATYRDMRKPPTEVILGELGPLRQECIDAIKHLDEWAAPTRPKLPLIYKMDTVHIRKDPLGTVLIIGAWNYAINLLLVPAVGAIAAGNTIVLKPSELSVHVGALLTQLLPKYLDSRSYRIINGGAQETTTLLENKFDHIFYTGSGNVGKIIMTAAAKHLTPVTLELGGKSPAFVTNDGNINVMARRLVGGKFFNSGQSCIAPDYVIVERGMEQELVSRLKHHIQEMYGASPQTSNSYSRVINKRHFHRLVSALKETQGEVVAGGDSQEDDLYIAPTLVLNVEPTDPLMQDEIFGPILPIWVVDSLEKGIEYVSRNDQPLALYVFSENKKKVDTILNNTRSGSVVVNDTLIQFSIHSLPFGGTGPSGMGNYHGKRSFDTFSHERSTIIKSLSMEKGNDLRFPPYSDTKISWLQWIMYDKASYPPNAANPGADKDGPDA
ncbi:Aldehyde dehydrogenase [Mortierella claussenii]|nr:Aldehyde dehydrogenase [Mortierella claussenii]